METVKALRLREVLQKAKKIIKHKLPKDLGYIIIYIKSL